MTPLYIFDLDGTLANIEHRMWHLKGKKDWKAFFADVANDVPIISTIRTMQRLKGGGSECWIWSGRSDECQVQTVTWLHDNGCIGDRDLAFGSPYRLKLRKEGDHREDHALKREWLSLIPSEDYRRLQAVFEDRSRVVQMWREAGVTCFQVAPGDF